MPSDPDATFTWQLLNSAQFFCTLMLSLVAIWKATRPHPPLSEAYVGRREFDQLVAQVTSLAAACRQTHESLELQIKGVDDERRASVARAYEAMRAAAAESRKEQSEGRADLRSDLVGLRSEIKGDITGLHARLSELSARVGEVAGAVAGELKRTR